MKNFKRKTSAVSVQSNSKKVKTVLRTSKTVAPSRSSASETAPATNAKKNLNHQSVSPEGTPPNPVPSPKKAGSDAEKPHAVSPKYTCFVGNLPYGTTAEAIRKFFHSVNVKQVRLLTDKATGQPRGCAFLELSSEEGYKKALAYHRQQLDGRTIRVQKTAGGGGKNPTRQEKIKKLNKKLSRERKRHWIKRRNETDSSTSIQDSNSQKNNSL